MLNRKVRSWYLQKGSFAIAHRKLHTSSFCVGANRLHPLWSSPCSEPNLVLLVCSLNLFSTLHNSTTTFTPILPPSLPLSIYMHTHMRLDVLHWVPTMSTDYSNGDCESLHQPLLHTGRSRINSTSQVAIVGANVCPIESLDYESVFFFSWFFTICSLKFWRSFLFFLWDFVCWEWICAQFFAFCSGVCRIIENEFFKQDWRSRRKIQILQFVSMKWVLCLLIGAIVGVVGFYHNLAVETFAGIKFVITSNLMLQRR